MQQHLASQSGSRMNAPWITKESAEAKWIDAADMCIEKWDLSSNPTSCPQALGIRPASEVNCLGMSRRPPVVLYCVDMPENLYVTNKS